jgi:hypothetical protein
MGSQVYARMDDLCDPQSQEAHHRNGPLDITGVYQKAISFILAKINLSPCHENKPPLTPHSTPAGFRKLVADYTMFLFRGNPQGWQ